MLHKKKIVYLLSLWCLMQPRNLTENLILSALSHIWQIISYHKLSNDEEIIGGNMEANKQICKLYLAFGVVKM